MVTEERKRRAQSKRCTCCKSAATSIQWRTRFGPATTLLALPLGIAVIDSASTLLTGRNFFATLFDVLTPTEDPFEVFTSLYQPSFFGFAEPDAARPAATLLAFAIFLLLILPRRVAGCSDCGAVTERRR